MQRKKDRIRAYLLDRLVGGGGGVAVGRGSGAHGHGDQGRGEDDLREPIHC